MTTFLPIRGCHDKATFLIGKILIKRSAECTFALAIVCYNIKLLLICMEGAETMSLRFVIGRSGTGKTTMILNEIKTS